MFGKFMNNYYYGKSGKGDYNPEDLPTTRWQLFWEMLRTRLSALCRMNLFYVLPWLPTIIVLVMLFNNTMSVMNQPYMVDEALLQINAGTVLADGSVQVTAEDGTTTQTYSPEEIAVLREFDAIPDEELAVQQVDYIKSQLLWTLILLVPCIFITGPWTAGVSYVTRNWARDEHAFMWSDCLDAMKENWKGSLVISGITSVVPLLAYLCWVFYGDLAADNLIMIVPQMLTLMVAIIWCLAVTYTYPMLVTYKMSVKTVIRNSLIIAVGRLPMSVGVRLLHCVPALLCVVLMFVINSIYVPLALLAYYALIGFTFSRFVTASYTNAQFDKFINSRIEGAKVNRGLAEEDDDEDWEDEEEEEQREVKPWENGYVDR